MTDDTTPTTAQSMLPAGYVQGTKEAVDAFDYRKTADPRYMAAVAAQQAAKAKLTLRRAPILRLVWNRDAALPDINVLLEAFKS